MGWWMWVLMLVGTAAFWAVVLMGIRALIPLLVVLTVGASFRVGAVVGSGLIGLAVLGAAGARLGGAPMVRPALRVFVGGAAAMGIAWLVGQLFDVQVA